jgi:phosphatidylserine/phosphatidylglycerophosphate/cardiolipin synthase-like enzyme
MSLNHLKLIPALLALLAAPLSAAQAPEGWLSPVKASYGAPAAGLPAPVYEKGNYSQIPDYSFAYLNDLNTKMIDSSLRSVDVCLYSVTIADNVDALERAVKRGVKVRFILDEKHVYPKAEQQVKRLMAMPGVEFRTLRGTRSWGVNHNKIVIGDGEIASAGSYNWTFGATFSSFENTVVLRNPVYVGGLKAYFDWMWSKARTLQQGASPEVPEGYYGTPPQDPNPLQSLNGVPVPAYLFSPGSRSEERLAALIDAARVSVDAVTFTFSSKPLADAVVRAKKRGVKVRFMMDKNMAPESAMARQVHEAGVDFRARIGRTDKGALHNKYAILDGQLLATGSFNWTTNASVNSFENIIFVSDPKVVKGYQANYDSIWFSASPVSAGDLQGQGAGQGE